MQVEEHSGKNSNAFWVTFTVFKRRRMKQSMDHKWSRVEPMRTPCSRVFYRPGALNPPDSLFCDFCFLQILSKINRCSVTCGYFLEYRSFLKLLKKLFHHITQGNVDLLDHLLKCGYCCVAFCTAAPLSHMLTHTQQMKGRQGNRD